MFWSLAKIYEELENLILFMFVSLCVLCVCAVTWCIQRGSSLMVNIVLKALTVLASTLEDIILPASPSFRTVIHGKFSVALIWLLLLQSTGYIFGDCFRWSGSLYMWCWFFFKVFIFIGIEPCLLLEMLLPSKKWAVHKYKISPAFWGMCVLV